MATAVIQIGNSDDKLTQAQWSAFVKETDRRVKELRTPIHFCGGSVVDAPWQNVCWVIELDMESRWPEYLRADLARLAKKYGQDSIALTVGVTEFVEAKA